MKRSFSAMAVMALALAISAASTAKAADKATLRLDWTIGPWQAPFILAQERGYYAAEGVELEILEGKGSLTTIQLVGRGNDTFGFVDASALPKAVSAGVPVKMIMGVLKRSMMSIVFRSDDKIRTVADLKGKAFTVTAGDAQANLVPAFLAANSLPTSAIKLMAVDPGAKYKLIIDGQVDGTVTYGALGIPLIESLSPKIVGRLSKFDFADSGINVPGFGVIASIETIKGKPKLVQAFARATARGWEEARKDPDAAIAAVLKRYPQIKNRDAEFHKTLSSLFEYVDTPKTAGKPFGWMSAEDWKSAEDLLVKYLDLKAAPAVDAYFTNEFVR